MFLSRISHKITRIKLGLLVFLSIIILNTLDKYSDFVVIEVFTNPIITALMYIVALNLYLWKYIRGIQGLVLEGLIVCAGFGITYVLWIA